MTRKALVFIVLAASACRQGKVVVTHPAIAVTRGDRIAADVILPTNVPTGGVPTVLIQTRYWRSFRLRGGGGKDRIPQGPRESIVNRLHAAGYAVVVTDVRGTGASDGAWPWPWSTDEVRDMGPVIDWIVAQKWSNGEVGATGVSYEGTTALLAAAAGRPSLKAVLARQIEWQLADEIVAPGGVRNVAFVDTWSQVVDDLDKGAYPSMFPWYAKWFVDGVSRRDDDPDGHFLRRLQRSRTPSSVATRVSVVRSGADPFGADGPATDSLGPAGHAAGLARTSAVVGIWGSWWDGATADAVLRAHAAMPIREAVIGPWDHEGTANASPLRRGASERPTVSLDSVVAFFHRHLPLAGVGTRATAHPSRVSWFVAGDETWRSASTWPATSDRTWRITGSRLADGPTAEADIAGDSAMTLAVDFSATTGTNNRWTSGLARRVDAPERAKAKGLRSWQSTPLLAPLKVFGPGRLRCNVRASADEAALHVYVESVDPRGQVRLLTEGAHRVRKDTSGDVVVRIRPVAFDLPAGWALRFSIAGADTTTFERLPAAGSATFTLDAQRCALTLPAVAPG